MELASSLLTAHFLDVLDTLAAIVRQIVRINLFICEVVKLSQFDRGLQLLCVVHR